VDDLNGNVQWEAGLHTVDMVDMVDILYGADINGLGLLRREEENWRKRRRRGAVYGNTFLVFSQNNDFMI